MMSGLALLNIPVLIGCGVALVALGGFMFWNSRRPKAYHPEKEGDKKLKDAKIKKGKYLTMVYRPEGISFEKLGSKYGHAKMALPTMPHSGMCFIAKQAKVATTKQEEQLEVYNASVQLLSTESPRSLYDALDIADSMQDVYSSEQSRLEQISKVLMIIAVCLWPLVVIVGLDKLAGGK